MSCPVSKEQLVTISQEHLIDYMYAGRGVINMEGPLGTNHTYLIKEPREDNMRFPQGTRFVFVLHTNEDGSVSEWYLGKIFRKQFSLTRSSMFKPTDDVTKGIKYLLEYADGKHTNTPMKIRHIGRCGRCGRPLIGNEARRLGFGKKCYKKLESERSKWTLS